MYWPCFIDTFLYHERIFTCEDNLCLNYNKNNFFALLHDFSVAYVVAIYCYYLNKLQILDILCNRRGSRPSRFQWVKPLDQCFSTFFYSRHPFLVEKHFDGTTGYNLLINGQKFASYPRVLQVTPDQNRSSKF